MMTEIRIYYEGDSCLKPGFHAFFREIVDQARARRCRIELIATGGTPKRDYDIAIRKHRNAWNILLLDSEGPNPDPHSASTFWMVEVMESWFHADKDALAQFYHGGFNASALKANPNVEQISKKDVIEGLKSATRGTRKGSYHKTKHAPGLLEAIDPCLVRKAAPHCDQLFSAVLAELS